MDVVVVGAGIIGCAVARELATRGRRVIVLDARAVALGATQASAGVLAPYIEAHEGGVLLDLTVRSLSLYDDWIDAVRAESGIDVEYRRTGSIEVALDEEGVDRLRSVAARFGSVARLEWLDGAAAKRLVPALSPRSLGGLCAADHGFVAAEVLTRALARSVEATGSLVLPRSRVRSVEPSADAVTVTTVDGTAYRTPHVVVATGSWTSLLNLSEDAAAADIRPVRGQLLRVGWRATPFRGVVWGPRCYLVPWSDGTVLVGATMEEAGFEERTTVEGVRTLLEAATEMLPEMAEASFLEARSGLRPATSDGLPIVGPSERSDRVVLATGHFRNGILLAPLTASLVAKLMVDGQRDPALDPLAPARLRKPAVRPGAIES